MVGNGLDRYAKKDSRRVSLPRGEGVTEGDERGIISNPEGRKEKRIATPSAKARNDKTMSF